MRNLSQRLLTKNNTFVEKLNICVFLVFNSNSNKNNTQISIQLSFAIVSDLPFTKKHIFTLNHNIALICDSNETETWKWKSGKSYENKKKKNIRKKQREKWCLSSVACEWYTLYSKIGNAK